MTTHLRMRAAALAALAALWLAPATPAWAAEDGGTVTGVVALPAPDRRGEPPVLNEGFVPRARNPLKAPRAFDPLPWVVVVLDGGDVDPADAAPPKTPVRYDVVGESFEVPLLPVVTGAKVEIKNVGKGSPRVYSPQESELLPGDPINPKGVRTSEAIAEPHRLIELRDHDSAHLRGHLVAFHHAYFALPDDSGRFEIAGVPAGTWTVKIWYRDGWIELPQKVTVSVSRRGARSVKVELPANLQPVPPAGA